jgi:hypothetical protein
MILNERVAFESIPARHPFPTIWADPFLLPIVNTGGSKMTWDVNPSTEELSTAERTVESWLWSSADFCSLTFLIVRRLAIPMCHKVWTDFFYISERCITDLFRFNSVLPKVSWHSGEGKPRIENRGAEVAEDRCCIEIMDVSFECGIVEEEALGERGSKYHHRSSRGAWGLKGYYYRFE